MYVYLLLQVLQLLPLVVHLMNNATNNNSNVFKDTNISSNSKTNKYNLTNNQDAANTTDNNIGAHTDNSDNSRGFESKENKFRSKGLEKILSNRK